MKCNTFTSKPYLAGSKRRDRFPSVAWLIERWHEWSATVAEWYDRQMMMIDGQYLSGDKSHKVIMITIIGK